MNTLIVSDVFEAYYEGRKGAFSPDQARLPDAKKREEKLRAEPANGDRFISKAA